MDSLPPVFGASDVDEFRPENSPRTYLIGVMTYRQRQAFFRELHRKAGRQLGRDAMLSGLRDALAELAPANLDDLLETLDEAEAEPESERFNGRLALIERAASAVPSYAALIEAQDAYNDARPWLAAQHGLRGWSGPGLPPFDAPGGKVPDDLLDSIPAFELTSIGNRAFMLSLVGRLAEKNSEAHSPLPESPAPTLEG